MQITEYDKFCILYLIGSSFKFFTVFFLLKSERATVTGDYIKYVMCIMRNVTFYFTRAENQRADHGSKHIISQSTFQVCIKAMSHENIQWHNYKCTTDIKVYSVKCIFLLRCATGGNYLSLNWWVEKLLR